MKIKKLLSVILSVLLLITIIPLGLFNITANATTYSGSCGTNLTWEYNTSTYTITISGTGEMNDYSCSSYSSFLYSGNYVTTAPWRSYYSSIKTVIINDGVTSIGKYAFYGCSGFKNITISETVTNIGIYSFFNCTNLLSITIPNSVISIGYDAFAECKNLTSLIIGDGVTSISMAAFVDCKKLKNITIGRNVTAIEDYAFRFCENITSIVIPDKVITIGIAAFEKCAGLSKITIPNSLTKINIDAFSGCTGLLEVYYRGISPHIEIGSNNDRLIDSIWHYNSCINSTTHTAAPEVIENYIEQSCAISGHYDSVVYCSICGDEISRECIVTPPTGIHKFIYTEMGDGTFVKTCEDCDYLFAVGITGDNTWVLNGTELTISGIGEMDNYSSTGPWGTDITKVIIEDGVTSIGTHAFDNCTEIDLIIIHDSVKKIGGYTFRNCTSLTNITIPVSIIDVGSFAFYNCTSLSDIHYKGTESQSSDINIGRQNNNLLDAEWHYDLLLHTEEHKTTVEIIGNFFNPTCGDLGSYDIVIYCSVCGEELSRTRIDIPPTGQHKPANAVVENAVLPTCGVSGSYDSVIYCSVCGVELGREHIIVPATGLHSFTHTDNGNGTHTVNCENCNYSKVEEHHHIENVCVCGAGDIVIPKDTMKNTVGFTDRIVNNVTFNKYGMYEIEFESAKSITNTKMIELDVFVSDATANDITVEILDESGNFADFEFSGLAAGWNHLAVRLSDLNQSADNFSNVDLGNISYFALYGKANTEVVVSNLYAADYVEGDANRDGVLDLRDVVRAKKMASGETEEGNKLAVSGDDYEINAVDLTNLIHSIIDSLFV